MTETPHDDRNDDYDDSELTDDERLAAASELHDLDDQERREALASMRQTFEKAERHARQQGITDAQIDEAVDDATQRTRYGDEFDPDEFMPLVHEALAGDIDAPGMERYDDPTQAPNDGES